MTATVVGPALAWLDPIDLDELTARAALQTRVDRKYVLARADLGGLLADLPADARVLQIDGARSFAYQSVYFDTPDLVSYLSAAHRRRRRFKVRTRTYLDSGCCWLEVKTRGERGSTVKNRLAHDVEAAGTVDEGRWFVERTLTDAAITPAAPMLLAPTLVTRYRRSTLYLPGTDSRATIDTELCWCVDPDRPGPALDHLELPELAIVETKTGATASAVDRLLWAHGHRPVRISKYATGLAALRPDLPATPWRRTLRRYFAPTGAPRPAPTRAPTRPGDPRPVTTWSSR